MTCNDVGNVPSLFATAQKIAKTGDQQMLVNPLELPVVERSVHVVPSGEVIICVVVPLDATAANSVSVGDQATEVQLLFAALVLAVHVMLDADAGVIVMLLDAAAPMLVVDEDVSDTSAA